MSKMNKPDKFHEVRVIIHKVLVRVINDIIKMDEYNIYRELVYHFRAILNSIILDVIDEQLANSEVPK